MLGEAHCGWSVIGGDRPTAALGPCSGASPGGLPASVLTGDYGIAKVGQSYHPFSTLAASETRAPRNLEQDCHQRRLCLPNLTEKGTSGNVEFARDLSHEIEESRQH